MDVLWSVLLGLVSMFCFAFANVFSKRLAQEVGPAHVLFLRAVTTVAVLGLAAIPHYHRLGDEIGVALLTLALGVAGYLPVLAFTHAIRESRLGIVAPIAATAPLITVLLSFLFLNIAVPAISWAAIALVIAANVFVAVNFADLRDSSILKRSSGVPLALCASLGWGVFFFLLVPSVRALGPWIAPMLVEVGVAAAAAAHLLWTKRSLRLRDAGRPAVIVNGLLIAVAISAFTYGVENFNVGILAALSNSTALVSTTLGVLLFKERLHAKEKIAGAAMVLGIAVLSIPH